MTRLAPPLVTLALTLTLLACSAAPPPPGERPPTEEEDMSPTIQANPPAVIHIEEHTRPIVSVVLVLPIGSLQDPPDKEGLAYLTGRMLMKGAGTLSQAQIADELDFLGSSLSVSVGRETLMVSGDALTRNLDAFETLMAAVLTEPTFPQEELDKLKRKTLAELAQIRDDDASLGQRFYVRRLFGAHPYGRRLKGTEESLARITRDDVVAFYKAHFGNANVLVGAAGDIGRDRLDTLIARTLGKLPVQLTPPPAIGEPPAAKGYQLVLVDKPERTQTQVFIGHPTVHATHEDYFPLLVANTVFGGTFTARLNHEIREKRGWSYGAYSSFSTDRRLGTFTIRFYPATKDTVPAMKLADELFTGLVDEGLSPQDVAFAQNYLANSHVFSIDTAERRLHELISARLTGRPDDYLDTFIKKVRAVTPAQVNAALKKHLTPDKVTVVVVATADELKAPLAEWKRPTSTETVDYKSE